MKFVEIYKTQNNGSQSILATCRLAGDVVVCEGDAIFIKSLEQEGVSDYSKNSSQKLFPKDGIVFLENLKFAFKSGYLNASDIKEK